MGASEVAMDIAKVGALADEASLVGRVHVEAVAKVALDAVVTEATGRAGPLLHQYGIEQKRIRYTVQMEETYETTTRSPLFTETTASPTSVTIPTPSWPITHGGYLLPRRPVAMSDR